VKKTEKSCGSFWSKYLLAINGKNKGLQDLAKRRPASMSTSIPPKLLKKKLSQTGGWWGLTQEKKGKTLDVVLLLSPDRGGGSCSCVVWKETARGNRRRGLPGEEGPVRVEPRQPRGGSPAQSAELEESPGATKRRSPPGGKSSKARLIWENIKHTAHESKETSRKEGGGAKKSRRLRPAILEDN